ncbi:hypothetical protein FACS1894219_08170 [Clostridia bacterium]|nr:hypothetical protein FACS1894219_08170 [Clostridia bacterium]
MNVVLDLVIVAIFIFTIVSGAYKGLIKILMKIARLIISFAVAKAFSPPLAVYLNNTFIKQTFSDSVSGQIDSFLTTNIDLPALATAPPDDFLSLIRSYGVDLPDVRQWMVDAVDAGTANVKEFVSEHIVSPIAFTISEAIAFAAVFAAAFLLLTILMFVIDKFSRLPVLDTINRVGGALIGVVYGFGISYLFVFIMSFVLPYFTTQGWIGTINEVVESTFIYVWFRDHSPVTFIINALTGT